MRLRNNPNAKEILLKHPEYVVLDFNTYKGELHCLFPNQQPIHIEIGMGKGNFIINMAKENPTINYIGIEKYDSVLVVALAKLLEEEYLPNLKFMCFDATNIANIFQPNKIAGLYLNFSDPWPKKRHTKRRLTYKSFLESYKTILKPESKMIFKTDHRELFEYSLVSMQQFGLQFIDVCLDLHHSVGYEDNIETEYEQKFGKNGPIYRLEVQF